MKSDESKEFNDIKRLLILLLLKLGSSSEELGLALGVDSSVVRKMIPARSIKKHCFVQSAGKVFPMKR